MIDPTILPLFFTTVFFLVIAPGPDLVLISSYSSTKGFSAGLMITLGIFAAGILQTLLVAFGLGQLMQSAPLFALIIKTIGALYLCYLGLTMLLRWKNQRTQHSNNAKAKPASHLNLIKRGLFNNLLNPKALLFFSLFLPQFTTAPGSQTLQILILGMLLSVVALIANLVFSLTFSQLGKVVGDRLNLARHIDGILGIIFLGLAWRLTKSA